MTDAKSAWHETSERFSSLGTKLKLHYEQKRGADAEASKAEVRDALKRLSGALEDAFEAIGTAARDEAVKSDVKQVGQSLATAIGATFSEVSAEVQRAFANRGGSAGEPGAWEQATTTEPAAHEPATTDPTSHEPAATDPTAPAGTTAEPSGPEPAAPGGPAESAGTGGGPEDPPKVEPWGTP